MNSSVKQYNPRFSGGSRPANAAAKSGSGKPASTAAKGAPKKAETQPEAEPVDQNDDLLNANADDADNLLKKERKPRLVLRESHLLSEKGLYAIYDRFPKLDVTGKPERAAHDSQQLMTAYKLWAHELFPKWNPYDVLDKAADWSGKHVIKSTLRRMRTELEVPRAQGVHTAATKSHYLEITQQICKAAEAEAERRKEGHGKRASEKLGDMDSDFDDEYEDEYGDGAGGRRRGRAHPMFDEREATLSDLEDDGLGDQRGRAGESDSDNDDNDGADAAAQTGKRGRSSAGAASRADTDSRDLHTGEDDDALLAAWQRSEEASEAAVAVTPAAAPSAAPAARRPAAANSDAEADTDTANSTAAKRPRLQSSSAAGAVDSDAEAPAPQTGPQKAIDASAGALPPADDDAFFSQFDPDALAAAATASAVS